MKPTRLALFASVFAGALLQGCGGGGGGSTDTGTGTGQTLSGKVIDGYIEGATVCLDLNLNRQCDAGERTAVTGVGGLYSLDISGLDNEDVASAMLLVDIPSTAKDADDGGLTLAQAGKSPAIMLAPVDLTDPGGHVVTPLTTLVADRMRNAGLTYALATDWVRSTIGLGPTAQLNIDFKAGADSETRRKIDEASSFLFDVQSRLTGRCILSKQEQGIGADDPALRECIKQSLATMATSFSWFFIPGLNDSERLAVIELLAQNAQAFEDLNASISGYSEPTHTMLATDFPAGLHELRDIGISNACAADPDCDGTGHYRVRASTSSSGGVFEVQDYYAIEQPGFVAQPRSDSYWELVGSQWVSVPAQQQITRRTDGDFALSGGEFGSTGVLLSARGFKLDGLGLNSAGLNRFSSAQTFPAGSNGYLLNLQTTTPRHVLSGAALTGPLQAPLTGSLADAYPSSATPTWTNALSSRTGMWLTFSPASGGGGSVTFRHPDVPSQVMADTGAYEIDVVDGQAILRISEIPDTVLDALAVAYPTAQADYRRGVRTIFAIAPDGGVREGTYTPVSVEMKPGLQMNRTALNAVLQALSLCQVDAEFGNTDCPN